MMGSPISAPFIWAKGALLGLNYPGVAPPAWNGTAVAVNPAYNYFTPGPGFAPTAEEFNYILASMTQSDRLAADRTSLLVASNWQPYATATTVGGTSGSFASTVAYAWGPPVWSVKNNVWITAPIPGTGTAFAFATLDGRTWTAYTTAAYTLEPNLVAMSMNPAGYLVSVQYSGTSPQAISATPAGAVSASVFPGTPTVPTQGVLFWFNNQWNFFGANQSSGTFTDTSYKTTINTGLSGWTSVTSSLPAAWQSGTDHVGLYLATQDETSPGNNDGTHFIVAMCGATAGTDTARLLNESLTDITPTFMSGKVVTGLGYSTFSSLWAVSVYDGTNTYLYSTPDRVTWTLCQTIFGFVTGLCPIGSSWAMAVPGQTALLPTRIMLTSNLDLGGSSSVGLAPTASIGFIATTPTTAPDAGGTYLYCNGSQLAAQSGENIAISLSVGPA